MILMDKVPTIKTIDKANSIYAKYISRLSKFTYSYRNTGQYNKGLLMDIIIEYCLYYKIIHRIPYRDIGRKVGLSTYAIFSYLNNKASIRTYQLIDILRVLGINIVDIFPEIKTDLNLLYFICKQLHQTPTELYLNDKIDSYIEKLRKESINL